ncbi:MAG: HAD family phosphatase [Candidatus Berkelbacteria bacterium]|nr:HAD family phosphatase [Candidatus Berkelbacteria bacterium]
MIKAIIFDMNGIIINDEHIHELATRNVLKEIGYALSHQDNSQFFVGKRDAEGFQEGKPDPEPYLVTAKKLKVKPSECVVIEDSPSGIQSAKSAGMYCIGVTTTYDKKFLSHADSIVDNFGEINNLIRSNIINRP